MEAEEPLATLRNIAGNYDVVFLVENNLAEEAKPVLWTIQRRFSLFAAEWIQHICYRVIMEKPIRQIFY